MLFTTKGSLHHQYLNFIGSTLYYTTGYGCRFLNPNGTVTLLNETDLFLEPFDDYINDHISISLKKTRSSNKSNILYLSYTDALVYYPVYHLKKYLGCIFVGPMKLTGLTSDHLLIKKEIEKNNNKERILNYLSQLPDIYQFQLNYLVNLLSLVANSSYYNSTDQLSLLNVSEEVIVPSVERLSYNIPHHKLHQEEKLIIDILLSDMDMETIAKRNFVNLVEPPLASHPLRSEKNRLIVGATTISRASIKLGLPSETAFMYSDFFIKKVEEYTTLEEVRSLQLEMFSFYKKELKKIHSEDQNHPITTLLLNYIDNHPKSTFNLEKICEILEVDYKYASKCFTDDKEVSFTIYFRQKKMKKAKILLETTNNSIQEISESLGYNYSYYFTRIFKKTFGITPTVYRKNSIINS